MLPTMDTRKHALDESKNDPGGNKKARMTPVGDTFWHEGRRLKHIPHYEQRGHIVNQDGATLVTAFTYGPLANHPNKHTRAGRPAITLLKDRQQPCKHASSCCECTKKFQKGDTVLKLGGKTFCTFDVKLGPHNCHVKYLDIHMVANYWFEKNAAEGAEAAPASRGLTTSFEHLTAKE
eukprot:COSAG05_NODE_569_length_8626_cov_19.707400_2_plen_178_part_00